MTRPMAILESGPYSNYSKLNFTTKLQCQSMIDGF